MDIFGPDEEYESEEEVEYVTLDLGTVEPALVPSSSSFRIIVRPSLPPITLTTFPIGSRHSGPVPSTLGDYIQRTTSELARH